ncbi:efflux transporter outer membrane subunit [Pelistega sp. NLN82]|uniref:Efflux transporter outer membrane subunit n=1 Tax=Pelistega ratti TaxID=2652177 RepID=A0A6L9Y9H4_9BURK|nr:efflux transporter outer membrane subunit [Pelistega ratti]NEN76507.1 efflux transporter outer membrane subunit [Pelistega ratti]
MRKISLFLFPFLLSACAVGPDYKEAPSLDIGQNYKASTFPEWSQSTNDWVQITQDDLSQGDWWRRFHDSTLNTLMAELNQSNFQIEQALASYDVALASLRSSRAGLFPALNTNASATRSGGDNQITNSAYSGSISAAWELDLWGKIRREVQASKASAQASAAELANMKLSLQGQLAKAYFNLRLVDAELDLLNRIVGSNERSLKVNENRYQQGVSARADVVSAMSALERARVSAINMKASRQQYESTIAVLLGKAPSQFSLTPEPFMANIPTVPVLLPSALLVRRPDIYIAERAVAKANEEIGIAQSAWLPTLNLSASTGLRESSFSDWLSAPLNFWSLGPALALSIFDGGTRQAAIASSKAEYRGRVAAYRQTVLNALKEVEDKMTLISVLNEQALAQQRALSSAQEFAKITRNQYLAGLVDYLSVTQAEDTANNTEISTLQLNNQRLEATIDLIMALGGGWSVSHDSTNQ